MRILLFILSFSLGFLLEMPHLNVSNAFHVIIITAMSFLIGGSVSKFTFTKNKSNVTLNAPIELKNANSIILWLGVSVMLFSISNLIFFTSLMSVYILFFGFGMVIFQVLFRNKKNIKQTLNS